nr:hypothetical protein BaRGS_002778 [Batillaria attramentaria]
METYSSVSPCVNVLHHNDTAGDINDTYTTVQYERPFLPWDNPENLMTLEQLEMTTIITNCVLNPLVLLVGVPTNIISCLVFYKQGLRDRMNLCLFVLALVDTVYLVSVFVIGVHSFIGLWAQDVGQKYDVTMSLYFSWFMWGMRAASGCITMVIAVERCVCVVFPLRANSIMRTRTMGALLTAIIIIFPLGRAYNVLNFRLPHTCAVTASKWLALSQQKTMTLVGKINCSV